MKSQTIARVAQSVSAVLLLAGLALPSHVAAAPVLSMSSAVGFPCVNVSVALSNNTPSVPYDPLAGVQFDITYPSAQFAVSSATAGAAASLQKLDTNPTLQAGRLRVLLSPNGSGTLSEGEIFTASFCAVAGAMFNPTTPSAFALQDAVLGNALGNLINAADFNTFTLTWEADSDLDGIPNNYDDDDDNDGMPDWYETQYGFNPKVANGSGDPDGDGVTNVNEYRYGLNPKLADSDGDGVLDADEIVQINNALIVIINSLLLN